MQVIIIFGGLGVNVGFSRQILLCYLDEFVVCLGYTLCRHTGFEVDEHFGGKYYNMGQLHGYGNFQKKPRKTQIFMAL